MKRKARYKGKRHLSFSLILHVVINSLIIICCIFFAFFINSRQANIRVIVIYAFFMISIMTVELWYFTRNVIRQVVKIEEAIQKLKRENESEFDREDVDNIYGQYYLIEMIQILMQREANANVMKKQAEIDTLQNQINPHFLYNTLETIRGQAICCGATEIAETTKALAEIFRYNISKKGSMIYLYEEITNIDSYMKIQSIRFNNKFKLTKQIDADVLNIKIPKLIIQPVVENAIKHGLEMKRDKGNILIKSFRTRNTLYVMVKDDGLGMSVDTIEEILQRLKNSRQFGVTLGNSTNVGLANISDRIKMIYGEKYGVSIKSIPDVGTEVTLSMGIVE